MINACPLSGHGAPRCWARLRRRRGRRRVPPAPQSPPGVGSAGGGGGGHQAAGSAPWTSVRAGVGVVPHIQRSQQVLDLLLLLAAASAQLVCVHVHPHALRPQDGRVRGGAGRLGCGSADGRGSVEAQPRGAEGEVDLLEEAERALLAEGRAGGIEGGGRPRGEQGGAVDEAVQPPA